MAQKKPLTLLKMSWISLSLPWRRSVLLVEKSKSDSKSGTVCGHKRKWSCSPGWTTSGENSGAVGNEREKLQTLRLFCPRNGWTNPMIEHLLHNVRDGFTACALIQHLWVQRRSAHWNHERLFQCVHISKLVSSVAIQPDSNQKTSRKQCSSYSSIIRENLYL